MAADGKSLTQIAARLYADKTPTPSEYKKISRNAPAHDFACVWGKSVILGILADEQYIGTYVAGKTKKIEVGSKKTVPVDPSEWIRIPDRHPAIIDKIVFDAAKERIDQKGEPLRKRRVGTWHRYKNIRSPLQGKTLCGCCNHTMILSSTKNAAFHCNFTRAAPDAECYRLKILAADLEKAVNRELRKQARAIIKRIGNSSSPSEPPIAQTARIRQIEDATRALYEKFVLKEVSREEYITLKAGLDAEREKTKLTAIQQAREYANRAVRENHFQLATDALNMKGLSKNLADVLIDKVRVFPGENIEITWKITGFAESEPSENCS
jgi:hypothetical protein